jgi:nicotinamide phosphoribosyltransferase
MNIQPKNDLRLSNILDVDSYKMSHFTQYPDGMTVMMSYLESRGGVWSDCTLFGLQYMIHQYVAKKFTLADVTEAQKFADLHGVPFNLEGWLHVLNEYDGMLPVRIRAIPEGTVVPVKNCILTVECRDPKCFWITNWLETMLSRVWYPSTIAIASRELKREWMKYLTLSSDSPEAEVAFKHHDFGARGVTSQEQAMLGGAAHLLSFLGSDTVAGVMMANHYYDCEMAGFSIPATEHSTMTVWGREGEKAALKQWIQRTLVDRKVPEGMPKVSACVADSYDVYKFAELVCQPDIVEMLKNSGGALVLRPDSGEPIEVMTKLFAIFTKHLPEGSITCNRKGFKMLPPWLRLIWGDGIDRNSMRSILYTMVELKYWSASNFAFGSGGGLLQAVNRDTQKFAFKCCYAEIDGQPVDVRKDPITDQGKRSKAGRLDLIIDEDGNYKTVACDHDMMQHPNSVLVDVFDHGDIKYHTTFDEVRNRMTL